MTTKCTGLMGRIFGHKWNYISIYIPTKFYHTGVLAYRTGGYVSVSLKCQRCGAVTGDNHGES